MKKLITAIALLSVPAISQAYMMIEHYDLTDTRPTYYSSVIGGEYTTGTYQAPEFFKNDWQFMSGDTGGYVSFEAYTHFDTQMFMVATGSDGGAGGFNDFGDVIAYGQPTGAVTAYGHNQKIEGYLDYFVDKDGNDWDGYAIIVAPVGLTEDMIKALDFSFIDDFFATNYRSPEYTLIANVPGLVTGSDPYHERPEGAETLNDQYFARYASDVPEPATTALLGLALAGGLVARRKKKA